MGYQAVLLLPYPLAGPMTKHLACLPTRRAQTHHVVNFPTNYFPSGPGGETGRFVSNEPYDRRLNIQNRIIDGNPWTRGAAPGRASAPQETSVRTRNLGPGEFLFAVGPHVSTGNGHRAYQSSDG